MRTSGISIALALIGLVCLASSVTAASLPEFSEMVVLGDPVSLQGGAYLDDSICGGSAEYRWTVEGSIVQDWSSAPYVPVPTTSSALLVEGRCAGAASIQGAVSLGSAWINLIGHFPLGGSLLTRLPNGDLEVSQIDTSGTDGVEIELVNTTRWDAQWADIGESSSLATGAFVKTEILGTVDNVPSQPIGFSLAEDLGDSVEFSANFSAIGSSTHSVLVFDGGPSGTLVASRTGWSGPLFRGIKIKRDSHIRPGGINLDITITRSRIALADGFQTDADYICIIPESPTSAVSKVSSVKLTAAHIPTVTIQEESVQVLGQTASVPISGWKGLFALAGCLALLSGAHIWRKT